MSMSAKDGVRLYVGNLPYSVRNEELYKMFADYGEILDVVVMLEPDNKERSRGFGFVTMKGQKEAEKAVEAINGKEVLGREMVCNIAKPRSPKFNF